MSSNSSPMRRSWAKQTNPPLLDRKVFGAVCFVMPTPGLPDSPPVSHETAMHSVMRKKMKAWGLLVVALLLACCSDRERQSFSQSIVALQELKASSDKDAFLVIANPTHDQHYLQFVAEEGGLIFDRPILAGSQKDLPEASARLYHPVPGPPEIENPSYERYLSDEETKRAEHYLAEWGMPVIASFKATRDEGGKIVGYMERFHGPFTVPADRFDEFLRGYFTEVFQIASSELNLQVITN